MVQLLLSMNTNIFVEQANKIHLSRYSYAKTVYKNAKSKLIITCPIHGSFIQSPRDHLSGCGCPSCGEEKRKASRSKTTVIFVTEAQSVHGNLYDYSKSVYINQSNKVIITCRIHGDFQQIPQSHLRGARCPKCTFKVPTKSIIDFDPRLYDQWHPTRNIILPESPISGNENIWWLCPVSLDHEWQAPVKGVVKSIRNGNSGCPCCAGIKIVPSNCLRTTHPDIANQWHPCKNGRLSSDKVGAGSEKRVWWICDLGHEWHARIYNRTRSKTNCPICKQSSGETAIEQVLVENKTIHRREYRFDSCRDDLPLPFDFAIMHLDGVVGVIEYQGEQHYKPVLHWGGQSSFSKIIKHDAIKRRYCLDKEIEFLAIPYWEYNNIPTLVTQFLNALDRKKIQHGRES